MYYYNQLIENMKDMLKKQKAELRKELHYLPAGKLWLNGNCFTRAVPGKDGIRRRGVTRDKEMLRKLARRRYIAAKLEWIDEELKKLSCLRPSPDAKDFLAGMEKAYRKLPDEYFFKPCGRRDRAEEKDYRQNPMNPEGKKHFTTFGEAMRSKSECIIAENLHESGVLFHYEEELVLDPEHIFYPDFTIFRSDGKIIYWEHCGLTADREYMRHHRNKLRCYEDFGITEWDNLIVTYDDPDGSLDIRRIKAAIDCRLL